MGSALSKRTNADNSKFKSFSPKPNDKQRLEVEIRSLKKRLKNGVDMMSEMRKSRICSMCTTDLGDKGDSFLENDDTYTLKDVEEVHGLRSYCVNPLFNVDILQAILAKLDHSSSLQARLVCKTWNEVAIPIISRNSKVVCFPMSLKKVDSVLSKAPRRLFRELWLEPKFLLQTECRVLLSDYGPNLIVVKLTNSGPLDARHLHLILSNWCPHLERLEYDELCKPHEELMGIFEDFNLLGRLNLKYAALSGMRPNKTDKGSSLAAHTIITIIKSSPKLVYLKLCTGSSDFSEILKGLKNLPGVAKNLESLRIDTFQEVPSACTLTAPPFEYLPLQPLLESSFGANLTTLTVVNSISIKQLPLLLTKFKESLENVILYTYGSLELYPPNRLKMLELPKMKRLKTFKNFSNSTKYVISCKCLEYMDNLETLLLSQYYEQETDDEEEEEEEEERVMNEMLQDSLELQVEIAPHKNLKSLTLVGKFIGISMIKMFPKVFPNLNHLHIELRPRYSERADTTIWIREAIQQISMIKSLLSLHLKFMENSVLDGEAFLYLRNIKGLKRLTMERSFEDDYGYPFPAGLEDTLCKLPELKCVTFISFVMLLRDAKRLIDSMAKHKIRVELPEFFDLLSSGIF